MSKPDDRSRIYVAATALALASVCLAIAFRCCLATELPGYVLVGAWALGPPIYFLWEFSSRFPEGAGESAEAERVKYLQELARNVWLALVLVLAAILGIKWPTE
jgi:hypothetical protein